MAKFIIFVIDDQTGSATSAEMAEIDTFNEMLQQNGYWIFAGGLANHTEGNVIDNRLGTLIETRKPLFNQQENYSGFWLLEVPTSEIARQLAFEGSKACNRKVELRPLLG